MLFYFKYVQANNETWILMLKTITMNMITVSIINVTMMEIIVTVLNAMLISDCSKILFFSKQGHWKLFVLMLSLITIIWLDTAWYHVHVSWKSFENNDTNEKYIIQWSHIVSYKLWFPSVWDTQHNAFSHQGDHWIRSIFCYQRSVDPLFSARPVNSIDNLVTKLIIIFCYIV